MLEEGVGDHGHQRVAMKTSPRAALEVVEAEFFLELLGSLLADPARLDRRGQCLEIDVGRQVGCRRSDYGANCGRKMDKQPPGKARKPLRRFPVTFRVDPTSCRAAILDAGPLIRIIVLAPRREQISRDRRGERHYLFTPEPFEIFEHRGDEFLSAGVLRGQGAREKIQ
jgi:hypothetical protein